MNATEPPPVSSGSRRRDSAGRSAWLGQGISLLFHVVLIFFGGLLLFQSVEYGIEMGDGGAPAAPGELSAEVELEQEVAPPVEEKVEKVEEVVKVEPEPVVMPEPAVDEDAEEVVAPKPPQPPKPVAAAKPVSKPKSQPAPQAKPSANPGGGGAGTSDSSGVGGAVSAKPNYLRNPPPPYPSEARKNKQEGKVVLQVRVNDRGTVDSLSLKQSSGFPLLDESALTAVKNWKFYPAKIGGISVESNVVVPVRFRLED